MRQAWDQAVHYRLLRGLLNARLSACQLLQAGRATVMGPELVYRVLTVMTSLSKHSGELPPPGLCVISLLLEQEKGLHYCSLDPGFLRDQESNKHFVLTAKPALLSEAREVRLLGESLSQTIKETLHTQQAGGRGPGSA